MFPVFKFLHAPEDDLAPVDYSYVSSVSEGRRREQAQQMHRPAGPTGPIVRHRAVPDLGEELPEYTVRPRRAVPEEYQTQGSFQAQSIALPDEYGIPDNPFQPPAETQQPARRSRAQRAMEQQEVQAQPVGQAQPVVQAQPVGRPQPAQQAVQGDQFDPPVKPEIPDWLRVAQQNNMPMQRPQAPRVQAAPRMQEEEIPVDALGRPMHNRRNVSQTRRPQSMADAYAEAGYPEALLSQQRQWEQEAASQPIRRRHGAQYATRPQPEPQPERRVTPSASSYPPPRSQFQPQAAQQQPAAYARGYHQPAEEPAYRVENEEYEEEERSVPEWIRRVPWLGIATFAAALAAVVLWILQMNYTSQTEQVLEQRAQQEMNIREKHPLKYEELIAEKAGKYNLHPAFVAAIMFNESSFRPDATAESTGARGLMQLMDETAGWIHDKMDLTTPYSFDSMYDAYTNAEFGCWYLNYLSELFYGDPILVAAAFHAGQGEVRNWLNNSAYSKDGRTIRLENMIDGNTKRYVTRVLDDFAVYKRLYYGG